MSLVIRKRRRSKFFKPPSVYSLFLEMRQVFTKQYGFSTYRRLKAFLKRFLNSNLGGLYFFKYMELTLPVLLVRSHFVSSIQTAKLLVRCGCICVNSRVVRDWFFAVGVGDIISVNRDAVSLYILRRLFCDLKCTIMTKRHRSMRIFARWRQRALHKPRRFKYLPKHYLGVKNFLISKNIIYKRSLKLKGVAVRVLGNLRLLVLLLLFYKFSRLIIIRKAISRFVKLRLASRPRLRSLSNLRVIRRNPLKFNFSKLFLSRVRRQMRLVPGFRSYFLGTDVSSEFKVRFLLAQQSAAFIPRYLKRYLLRSRHFNPLRKKFFTTIELLSILSNHYGSLFSKSRIYRGNLFLLRSYPSRFKRYVKKLQLSKHRMSRVKLYLRRVNQILLKDYRSRLYRFRALKVRALRLRFFLFFRFIRFYNRFSVVQRQRFLVFKFLRSVRSSVSIGDLSGGAAVRLMQLSYHRFRSFVYSRRLRKFMKFLKWFKSAVSVRLIIAGLYNFRLLYRFSLYSFIFFKRLTYCNLMVNHTKRLHFQTKLKVNRFFFNRRRRPVPYNYSFSQQAGISWFSPVILSGDTAGLDLVYPRLQRKFKFFGLNFIINFFSENRRGRYTYVYGHNRFSSSKVFSVMWRVFSRFKVTFREYWEEVRLYERRYLARKKFRIIYFCRSLAELWHSATKPALLKFVAFYLTGYTPKYHSLALLYRLTNKQRVEERSFLSRLSKRPFICMPESLRVKLISLSNFPYLKDMDADLDDKEFFIKFKEIVDIYKQTLDFRFGNSDLKKLTRLFVDSMFSHFRGFKRFPRKFLRFYRDAGDSYRWKKQVLNRRFYTADRFSSKYSSRRVFSGFRSREYVASVMVPRFFEIDYCGFYAGIVRLPFAFDYFYRFPNYLSLLAGLNRFFKHFRR